MIKSRICTVDNFVGSLAETFTTGNPKTHGGGGGPNTRRHSEFGLFYSLTYILSPFICLLNSSFRQQDGEFFATKAGCHIIITNRLFEKFCYPYEGLITGKMPIGVI